MSNSKPMQVVISAYMNNRGPVTLYGAPKLRPFRLKPGAVRVVNLTYQQMECLMIHGDGKVVVSYRCVGKPEKGGLK